MDEQLKELTIGPGATIREAMAAIDRGALGIALVVHGGRLAGTVTDGDARRAILRGSQLDEPVSTIMTREPTIATTRMDMQAIRQLFIQSKLRHVPVVDDHGMLKTLLTAAQSLSVPLSNPDITDREIAAALDVLRSPNLSLGPKVIEFEQKIAAYSERKYAITVNSGTSGLHLVVRALGLGPGDEVITTPFSFIASSNCMLFEGATPVFVDIRADTYNIDPALIERAITPQTKAILAVDVFGQPADYDALDDIAARHGLRVISDCCESIGAEYRGAKASRRGVAGVFGFYPNKQITTGEGGAIVTDDPEIARLCRSMRNQGRGDAGGWLSHERLGYNYRLPDICCAIGVVQLERIDEFLTRREAVAAAYIKKLAGAPRLIAPYVAPDTTRMSWFVFVVRLTDDCTRADRDQILQELRRHGIGANNYFQPIHLQPFYQSQFGHRAGAFPVTEAIADRTIALPFHNNITPTEVDLVVSRLHDAIHATCVAG